MRVAAAVIAYIVALVVFSGACFELFRQQEAFYAESNDAFTRIETLSEQIEQRLDEINVPPTKDRIYDIMTRGVGVAEMVWRTDTSTGTPEAAFATDLTATQKSDAYVQQIVLRNTSSDNGGVAATLCWAPIAWVSTTACNALCAASGLTCSGAATDGMHLAGGSEVARRLDGTNCVCVVGASTYQSQRITR